MVGRYSFLGAERMNDGENVESLKVNGKIFKDRENEGVR